MCACNRFIKYCYTGHPRPSNLSRPSQSKDMLCKVKELHPFGLAPLKLDIRTYSIVQMCSALVYAPLQVHVDAICATVIEYAVVSTDAGIFIVQLLALPIPTTTLDTSIVRSDHQPKWYTASGDGVGCDFDFGYGMDVDGEDSGFVL